METFLIRALQLIMSLSLLVIIHEGGHFLFARVFKVRVEKFCLFFEQMKQPEQPWEFRSKPAWQRLLIMVGGVLFNFLLALFIYSMILFAWGDQYI